MNKTLPKFSKIILTLTLVTAGLFLGAQKAEAAIRYVGGITASSTDSTYSVSLTSLTEGLASSPAEGDIVVVLMAHTGTSDADLSITGYTELADLFSDDTRDSNLYVGYKIMGVTPDTSVTVEGSGDSTLAGTAIVQVWRGVDQSNPIDVDTTTATGTDSLVANPPGNTPVTPGALIVAAYHAGADNGVGAKTAPAPLEYPLNARGTGTAASVSAMAVWHMHQLAVFDPGSFNGGFSNSNHSWGAATIVLRPAAPYVPYYRVRQPSSAFTSGTTGAVTYAWPAHETNDIGVLFIESDANETTLSTPNGFERLGTTQSATGTRLDVFWARATTTNNMGSPVAAANSDHMTGFLATFRGAVTVGNPFSAVAGDVKNEASVTSTAPAVTATEDNQLIIFAVTNDLDATGAFASNPVNSNLRGITERADSRTASGNGGGIAMYTALKEVAGDTGTTDITVISSVSAMMTLALRGIGTAPTVALNTPANAATGQSATPTFNFTGTDAEADTLEYQIQIDNNNDFSSVTIDKVSETDTGFTAGHPFASGVAKEFTVQAGDELSSGTYYWRVRALDTTGTTGYGEWSETRSFTVGTVSEGEASGTRSFFKFRAPSGGLRFLGGRILFK